MEENNVVYIIENKNNGKRYVGKTEKSFEHRWGKHVSSSKHSNIYFHKAIRKHGPDAFDNVAGYTPGEAFLQRFGLTTNEVLNAIEIGLIARLGTTNPKVGYNGTTGGEGCKPTEETLAKMKRAKKKWANSPEGIALLTRIRPEAGRIGGRINGRNAVKNKTGIHGRTSEQVVKDSHKGGCKRFELHGSMQTHEGSVKGGLIGGRKAKESGQFARMLSLPQTKIGQQRNGRIQGQIRGRMCAETKTGVCGQSLEKMRENGRKQPREAKVRGGHTSMHLYWHVRRNVKNPNCELCKSAISAGL